MSYIAEDYDVVVIGAGHAGCEAALASARLGMKTAVFVINLDTLANMPCNPSIGGTSKGHLVKEIDCLGGEMGKIADKTYLQSKMLNTSKGPAVHSLRMQADRKKYHIEMKKVMENQENLDIYQAEITKILTNKENTKVTGVMTKIGAIYNTKAIIVATGTYLKGKIIIGDVMYESGPDGVFPANDLSQSLLDIGVELRRFKTGTPARINVNNIDLKGMEIQLGDIKPKFFSYESEFSKTYNKEVLRKEQEPCYLTYTNEKMHQLVLSSLHKSPIYGGKIKGIGPRYCPSIEDKIVRFRDKERHQIFIEPMGENTNEMYIQGFSTSMPEELQIQMYRATKGLENAKLMRPAYAIEYDCIDSLNLNLNLEYKGIEKLFFAGQVNGSSGYEEAAAQGLMAGINAVLSLHNKKPFILDRSTAYIGVLIDDLVTKGTNEPYRMMTSRAEYRLNLRQDNTDIRLMEKGYNLGLIPEKAYKFLKNKIKKIDKEIERLKKLNIYPSKKLDELFDEIGSSKINVPYKAADLLKRSEISYDNLTDFDETRPKLSKEVINQVEIMLKYEGYIKLQEQQINEFKKLEKKQLNENIEYSKIKGLCLEARQKLDKQKPLSVGQASRISGVSPADISVLLIYLAQGSNDNE